MVNSRPKPLPLIISYIFDLTAFSQLCSDIQIIGLKIAVSVVRFRPWATQPTRRDRSRTRRRGGLPHHPENLAVGFPCKSGKILSK